MMLTAHLKVLKLSNVITQEHAITFSSLSQQPGHLVPMQKINSEIINFPNYLT